MIESNKTKRTGKNTFAYRSKKNYQQILQYNPREHRGTAKTSETEQPVIAYLEVDDDDDDAYRYIKKICTLLHIHFWHTESFSLVIKYKTLSIKNCLAPSPKKSVMPCYIDRLRVCKNQCLYRQFTNCLYNFNFKSRI
jgi:hypothetical protein